MDAVTPRGIDLRITASKHCNNQELTVAPVTGTLPNIATDK
jgi:hypothetical protein